MLNVIRTVGILFKHSLRSKYYKRNVLNPLTEEQWKMVLKQYI